MNLDNNLQLVKHSTAKVSALRPHRQKSGSAQTNFAKTRSFKPLPSFCCGLPGFRRGLPGFGCGPPGFCRRPHGLCREPPPWLLPRPKSKGIKLKKVERGPEEARNSFEGRLVLFQRDLRPQHMQSYHTVPSPYVSLKESLEAR